MYRHQLVLIWVLVLNPATVLFADETGLKAPPDFEVSLYASDDLAHDIYSMTIDSHGRVVVAGAGYVKILHDDDADGRADRATLFSSVPASGAHGMCFDGPDLICTGDNSVMRLRDPDGDGTADGVPVVLTNLRHPEHGANGVVQGPDGWFYIICGNDAGVTEKHVTTKGSPIKNPQCGAVVRISPDGKQSEVVAHGFRNPYDLAFGVDGALFTVDADGERDQYLPWYSPTRLFDIATGMHHGWMLQGWQKSWNRPAWFPDNVDRLCEIGRGSPTGVIVYRHRQFPERFRGSVFSCCWTLGRVYHFPLERNGSSFKTEKEIFLETTGDVGFAPVDLAVGPTGDLFVAIGGRRTRGSVFRVRYKDGSVSDNIAKTERPGLLKVLSADEPLSAWSRAKWVRAANNLGRSAFVSALHNEHYTVEQRVRAVEILTELFDGFPVYPVSLPGSPDYQFGTQLVTDPVVMARLAWSIARRQQTAAGRDTLLLWTRWRNVSNPGQELQEPSAWIVRRAAWEALLAMPPISGSQYQRNFESSKSREDDRARFAQLVADAGYNETVETQVKDSAITLHWLWQLHLRGKLESSHAQHAIRLLRQATSVSESLEAIRLVELAFGDIETSDENPQVLPGYALRGDLKFQSRLLDELTAALLGFPDEVREVNLELARLCGMLGVRDPALPGRIVQQCTAESRVEDDLHYLMSLALLETPHDEATTELTAAALVGLAGKMERNKQYPSRNWPLRVGELCERLYRRDAKLAGAMTEDAQFGHPNHALLVKHMPAMSRVDAARRLLEKIEAAGSEWSPDLVAVAAALPDAEAFSTLRERWEDYSSRDAIVQVLARAPDKADRDRFAAALGSPQPEITELAANALAKLELDPTDDEWLAVIKSLRRYVATLQHEKVRLALAKLLTQWSKGDAPEKPLRKTDSREAYQPYFDWFAAKHRDLATRVAVWSDDVTAWRDRLAKVNWEKGEVQRGQTIFEKRTCHRCHAGSGPLGPDLAGVTSRLSRDDLFAHIIDPNKEVSPVYQTTQVVTGGGRIVVGLIVYESPESTLVQTGPDTTVRIVGEEILSMAKSNQSLMPVGLLNDVTPDELADLYAYMQTIQKK